MGNRMALDIHQARVGHLLGLLPGHKVGIVAEIVRNDKDRGLGFVLLEQGEELGIVVVVAVVKGQNHRLFDFVHPVEVGEPDGRIAVVLEIFQLLLQIRGPDEELRRAPGVIADAVVHQHRHLVALGDLPVGARVEIPDVPGGVGAGVIVQHVGEQRHGGQQLALVLVYRPGQGAGGLVQRPGAGGGLDGQRLLAPAQGDRLTLQGQVAVQDPGHVPQPDIRTVLHGDAAAGERPAQQRHRRQKGRAGRFRRFRLRLGFRLRLRFGDRFGHRISRFRHHGLRVRLRLRRGGVAAAQQQRQKYKKHRKSFHSGSSFRSKYGNGQGNHGLEQGAVVSGPVGAACMAARTGATTSHTPSLTHQPVGARIARPCPAPQPPGLEQNEPGHGGMWACRPTAKRGPVRPAGHLAHGTRRTPEAFHVPQGHFTWYRHISPPMAISLCKAAPTALPVMPSRPPGRGGRPAPAARPHWG